MALPGALLLFYGFMALWHIVGGIGVAAGVVGLIALLCRAGKN